VDYQLQERSKHWRERWNEKHGTRKKQLGDGQGGAKATAGTRQRDD
jgi:hypothetical protein